MLQLLFDIFTGKAKTRIYTSFLGWLLILHADLLFIALLTDQKILYESKHQLKGEYLWSYITHFGWDWSISLELLRVVGAVVFTYLMIWVVPKLINERSYKEELAVEYILRRMKVEKEEELTDREEKTVKRQLKTVGKEKELALEKVKLESKPEQLIWDEDFEKFTKSSAYNFFDRLITIIYSFGGDQTRTSTRLNASVVAYYDTNEIITMNNSIISFTPKGRYFVKRHSELN